MTTAPWRSRVPCAPVLSSVPGPALGLVVTALSVALAVSACSRDEGSAEERESEDLAAQPVDEHGGAVALRTLTGAPTRVAWVQDVGSGNDPFARGEELVLMGLDTDDGRGERSILGTPSNYSKPLIVPGGDRVVFSDRLRKKVFVVDWDGASLREVTDGYALDVWREPSSDVVWVYVGSYEGQEEPDQYETVHRVQLNRPEARELVWDRTPVSADSFQVAPDGEQAGGVFPWPQAGVAELPNRDLNRLGRGCWTALAPDGTDRLWIFDGAHRHVTIVDPGTGGRTKVSINSAPSVEGHEVYHPRWSNDPRILAVSGPYEGPVVGENRIRSGGESVEIHAGRLNADATSVEAWARVTHNERADFYPDVWVEADQGSRRTAPPPGGSEDAGSAPAADAWFVDPQGLVYVWKNRRGPNEIPAPDGGAPTVCRAEARGHARYGRHLGMNLAGGAFVAVDAGERIVEACRSSDRFTLEVTLVPDRASQRGAIVSLDHSTEAPDFVLSQEEEQLQLRFRTSSGEHESTFGRLEAGRPHHVLVSYAPGELLVWIDGREVKRHDTQDGQLDAWRGERLVFGDVLGGGRDWHGTLEGIAIHRRTIDGEEARSRFEAHERRLDGRTAPEQLVVAVQVVETSGIPKPASIAPYRRALAAHRYEVLRVEEGTYEKDELMAAHWVILDGEVLPSAKRAPGERYLLTLEDYAERPDLEGERLAMDGDTFRLPLFYEVQGRPLPGTSARTSRD